MKQRMKRIFAFVIALVLVVSLLPASLLVVDAAGSLTVTDPNIGLSWTDASNSKGKATWSASGNTVTGTSTGYTQMVIFGKTVTTKLTITNNYADERTLEFTFSLSGGGSVSGDISGTSGSYSAPLAAGGSLTITLTSPSGSSTNTLTLSGLQLLGNEPVSSTFKAPVNGSYTVDGTAITADTTIEKVATESYTLVATPASGYKFFGWWSNTMASYLSTEATASLNFSADPQLEPRFIPADYAIFRVGDKTFPTLSEAGAYAATATTKTIIPVADGTVYGEHTIPAGVTLLIPYNSNNTLIKDDPSCTSSLMNNVAWVQPTAYRTLTLAENARITVNGAISVSAQHAAANGGKDFCGAPTGPCGFIHMNTGAKITLNSGSNLYAWGFITGAGTIDALNGATVYEMFQFTDFRGGSVTTDLADAKIAFPMSQYYVQNIETAITFYQGAKEKLSTSVYMSNMCLGGDVTFIGNGGMFVAGEGGYVTKTYDGSRDRLVFEVYENATINSISLSLSGTTVNSADYVLPINSNIDIYIRSGVGNVSQSIALLPGASITIDQGSVANLNYSSKATNSFSTGHNVMVYDADQWGKGGQNKDTGAEVTGGYVFYTNKCVNLGPIKYAPGKKYTRTEADLTDACVNINGTAILDGYIYTTLGGANIISSEGTGRVEFLRNAGTEPYAYQYIQSGEITVRIPIVPAMLKNADGSFTQTAGASAGDVYFYKDGKWVFYTTVTWTDDQGNTLEIDQNVLSGSTPTYDGAVPQKAADNTNHYTFSGWTPTVSAVTGKTTYTASFAAEAHSYTVTTVEPTCTVDGSRTSTCSVCGHSMVETLTAPGHQYDVAVQEASCTADGLKTYTCTVCGDTYTEVLPATGHVNTTTTTVDATCTEDGSVTVTCACGYVVSVETIDALGHNYGKTVTAPTCTEDGYTTYTCDRCGDTYTADVVPATGHVNTTTTTVDATCTEDGSVTVTCACGKVVSVETIDALGHNYGKVITAPTCTEDGYTTYTCDRCGDTYTADVVPATGHVNTTTTTVEATCTENGSITVTCACGYVVSVETIDALGHSYDAGVVTAPTCTEDGYTTYTCDRCGDTYTDDVVPATGHVNTTTTTVDATCTENGSVTVTCACGYVVSVETIDALGHNYGKTVTAPTCTEDGYTTYTCDRCGDTYTDDVVPATGHSYTYVNNGKDHTVGCSNCDYSVTEAHTYADSICVCGAKEAVASVTNDEGVVTEFASLEAALSAAESGDAVSLLADITLETRITVDKKLTLNLNGYTLTTCGTADNYDIIIKGDLTICDSSDAKTGTLVAPGIYGIGVSTTAGSSLTIESGNFTQIGDYYLIGSWGTVTIHGGSFYAPYCTVNAFAGTTFITGGSFSSDAADSILLAGNVVLTGGSYDREVQEFCAEEYITDESFTVIPCTHGNTTTETVDPTCTEPGSVTVTCDDCGKLISTETLAATGHVNTTTTTVEATCTENGSITVTCACGYVVSVETIDALGHNYGKVITAPTCTEDGYTTYTCDRCGDTYTADVVPAIGHSYTYTNNGEDHTVGCTNCDYSLTEAHTYEEGLCICGAAEKIVAVTDSQGNTTNYTSLIEAIAAAEAGDTVSLLRDVTLEERIILDAEDDIILDLNGKTLTTCGTADNYDIVIKGDLTIMDSSDAKTGTLVAPGIYGIGVSTTAGASLTIESGNFTQIGDYYLIGSWGTVTIHGGSFYAPYCTVNAFAGTAFITGGSFSSDAADSILLAGNVVLTGGSYDREVQEFCAEEYITDESFTVIPCTHGNTTTETVDPTCTEPGSVTVTCDDCGKLISTETLAATGHVNTTTTTVDATCTENGSITVTCACGEVISTEVIPATGHIQTETVKVDATCTEDGSITVTCACGEVFSTEVIPATGHSYTYTNNGEDHTVGCTNCDYTAVESHTYVDGTCICGAVEVTTPSQANIKIGHSLSLDSDLRVKYRVKYTDIAAVIPNYIAESAYLVVEKDRYPAGGGMFVQTEKLTVDLTSDPERMIFDLKGIQSAEMGSELRAVLHIFDAEGREYVSAIDVYSIRIYVESALQRISYETQPKMVTMLIDLLNYGAAAQVNFGRRTDELVHAGFEAYQQYATKELAAELTDVKETSSNDRSITAVSKMGFSINLADRTEINAKMTLAEGYTMEDISKVEVRNAAGDVVDTITEFKLLVDDNNRVQLTFSGVRSVNMRDMFYFLAYVGDQIASDTYGYSIEASARTTIASSTGSSADMILACMYYGDSAAAYFGK